MSLVDENGRIILPSPAAEMILGREHFPRTHDKAASVSRKQCKVEWTQLPNNDHRQLILTSMAQQNPTLVLKCSPAESILLTTGEKCQLEEGDKICMLSVDTTHYLQFQREASATQSDTVGLLKSETSPFKLSDPVRESKPTELEHRLQQTNATETSTRVPFPMSQDHDSPFAGDLRATATDQGVVAEPINQVPLDASDGLAAKRSPEPLGICRAKRLVMLILVGVPGSGKSSLSEKLELDSAFWKRANQDTVKNGGRGTRKQCVNLASRTLQAGGCPIIDRCNVDQSQRQDFLQLAALTGTEVHAVVLDLPRKLCEQQAMNRIAHEGNLSGPKARGVVAQMHGAMSKAGLPKHAEGFSSILVCQNHKEIALAFDLLSQLPGSAPDFNPEPIFLERKGAKKSSIQNFFKVKPSAYTIKPSVSPMEKAGACQDPGLRHETVTKQSQGIEAPPSLGKGVSGSAQAASNGCQAEMDTEPLHRLHVQSGSNTHSKVEQTPVTNQVHSSQQFGLSSQGSLLSDPAEPPASRIRKAEEENMGAVPKVAKNAFATLLTASKKLAISKRAESSGTEATTGEAEAEVERVQYAKGPHAMVLRNVALNPERESAKYPGIEIHSEFVIILDKFPKAKLHGLVIARNPALHGPADLRREHLDLLDAMEAHARRWAAAKLGGSTEEVRLGFHAIPSLQQLHLHVISQDFDSPSLKSKKHWNSFTTSFFLDIESVKARLLKDGRQNINCTAMKELLRADLQCINCQQTFGQMPKLLYHIKYCRKSRSDLT